MRYLGCCLLLLLGACAVGPDKATVLNGLVGQDETVAVRTLGVPSRMIETGGHRFLAYEEEAPSQVYGGAGYLGFAGGMGNGFFGSGFGGSGFGGPGFGGLSAQVVRYGCETTLDVADRRVVTWTRRGNAC